MTKHFGPAHLKRDVPGLEAFAFAGEAPPRTAVIYGTNGRREPADGVPSCLFPVLAREMSRPAIQHLTLGDLKFFADCVRDALILMRD